MPNQAMWLEYGRRVAAWSDLTPVSLLVGEGLSALRASCSNSLSQLGMPPNWNTKDTFRELWREGESVPQ